MRGSNIAAAGSGGTIESPHWPFMAIAYIHPGGRSANRTTAHSRASRIEWCKGSKASRSRRPEAPSAEKQVSWSHNERLRPDPIYAFVPLPLVSAQSEPFCYACFSFPHFLHAWSRVLPDLPC